MHRQLNTGLFFAAILHAASGIRWSPRREQARLDFIAILGVGAVMEWERR